MFAASADFDRCQQRSVRLWQQVWGAACGRLHAQLWSETALRGEAGVDQTHHVQVGLVSCLGSP
jgi:hypothetical protein